jgi:Uma2 family endonuclease
MVRHAPRDEIIKRRFYERFRMAEYWVVDPELDTDA